MKTQNLFLRCGLGAASAFLLGVVAPPMPTAQAVAAEDSTTRTRAQLEAWTEQATVNRRGLPERGRSRHEAAFSVSADNVSSLLTRFTPFSAAVVGAAPPTRKAAGDNNEVWTLSFQEQSVIHEFAGHFRPDDARPLYWRGAGLAPDPNPTFDEAARVVLQKILRHQRPRVHLTGRPQLVNGAAVILRNWQGPLTPPWERCWFFFIDDEPQANWEHPCRYVFVAEDLSAFAVQYGRSPATLESQQNGTRVEETLQPVAGQESAPVAPVPQQTIQATPADANALTYSGSAENSYAVIISGGHDAYWNWQRYWGDSAFFYSTLTRKYGYRDDHIFALISDGTNPGNDRDIGDRDHPVYDNSPTDLDGDGDVDTDFSCTKANVGAVFNTLAGLLTSNDQLVVFITDHGGQESGHDATVSLWGDTLRDDELMDMTLDLPCTVMFIMETCYSGGFVDDLDQDNRVIGTACAYDDTSVAGTTYPTYDQWVYYFTAAMRGFYPGAHPWNDGAACDADANNDGRVSFKEAWDFAYANRDPGDVPQYGSHPAALGTTLYLNQLHIALENDTPLTYSTIPKDFSFQVLDYDWAIVGIAPSTDHDLRADEDRLFSSPYQSSTFGGTTPEFIVVNGHQTGEATHYAQVYFGAASSYDIEAQWLPYDLTFGTGYADSINASEVHQLYEVYLTAGQEVDLTLNVTAGTADVALYVFRPTRTSGRRGSYDWNSIGAGAGADESLSFIAPSSGYYGIAVINDNGGWANYTILAAPPPPLAAPTGVAASDGTYADHIAVTWNSVAEATHYKVYRNTANSSASATAITGWQPNTSTNDYGANAGRRYYYWVKAAASSDGNRESAFSAVASGYVAPMTLVSDGAVATPNDPAYYQFRDPNATWWAVGVRAISTNDNWSLRLYSDPAFGTQLTNSAYLTPVDFVIGDGHHVAYQNRGIQAYRASGTGQATVEFEGSSETLTIGTNASITWPAGDVVEMWDLYLTNGTYQFDLTYNSGAADLNCALFGSADGLYYKNRERYLARSDKAGGGVREAFWLTVSSNDFYGLCVWANDTNTANFNLIVTPLEAGLWEGDLSANWHTSGNWRDNHVPTASVDVTIPAGTRYRPEITNAAYCRNLTIESGAQLTLYRTNLYVGADVVVYGTLNLSNTGSRLYVEDDVYWEAGSTANLVGSARMLIRGDWNFESGANVRLNTGYTEFVGTTPSWIRSYEARCNLHNLNCSKTNSYVGVSGVCVDELHINNLYNYDLSSFVSYSQYPVVIGGFFNNMGGNFRCYNGTVVFGGDAGVVPLKPNIGDYFNHLTIRSTTPLTLDAVYTNTLVVRGDLVIESSSLNANGLNIEVGGDWRNEAGVAGFQAGAGTVRFVGTTADQRVEGVTLFNNLYDDRSGAGTLEIHGPTTVISNYTATFLNGVHTNLQVNRTLNLNNAACSFTIYPGADVVVSNVNLGGRLNGFGGGLTAWEVTDTALYGQITVTDGAINLHQGTGFLETVDLRGSVDVSGGELNVYGGNTNSVWPGISGAAIIVSGGTLDFKNQGIYLPTTALSYTQYFGGGTIRTAKGFVAERADFRPTAGTLEFTGGASGPFSLAAGSYCRDVLVTKSRATVTAGTDLDIRGDFTIVSGVFVAPAYMAVGGSWSNIASFVEGTGTVAFTGNKPADILTSETFYNLTVNKQTPLFPLRYTYELELMGSKTVHVLRDLLIQDGCLEMNDYSTLDVETNLTLSLGAGLNANDRSPAIFVGGNWVNNNTNYANSYGFDSGYSSTVTFDGAGNGIMTTAAPQERFGHLRVDRPGGSFRPASSVVAVGNVSIANGSWSFFNSGLSHFFRGNLAIASGGSWMDHSVGSAVRFEGFAEQTLEDLSTSGYFNNVVVDKNPVDPSLPLTPLRLLSRLLMLGGPALTVEKGYLDLNGNYIRCTGDVTVNKGGLLAINAGAWLEVGSGKSLTVNTGAVLSVIGVPGSSARVTHHAGNYNLNVEQGGTLSAEYGAFEYFSVGGVYVKDGAIVDPAHAFNYCSFSNNLSGGTLLRVDNNQNLTINGARFPASPGGAGAANVRKELNQGRLSFTGASGAFAGEAFDYDPFDRIDWNSGLLTSVALQGPAVATKDGTYDFQATVFGEVPMMPISYFWQALDHAPETHVRSELADATSLGWDTEGAKWVRITASNALNSVSALHNLDVAELRISRINCSRTDGSNWVFLKLTGTSSNSVYTVLWNTNLMIPDWVPADPDGATIPGQNWETDWTDWGNTNRNLNTLPNLFFRARINQP